MLQEDNTIVKSLVTLTMYNSQSLDSNKCLAYPTTSYIWNSLKCIDDNKEFVTVHYYLIITNTGSSQAYIKMRLISNIDNDIMIIWHTIIKTATSSTLEIIVDIRNDMNDGYESIELFSTVQDGEFTLCLINKIQSIVGNH